MPGEWCDPRWAFDPTVRCQIVALTGVTAEIIPVTQLYESRGPSASLIKKMIGAMIRSMAYQDDRIICLGSKNAMEIVASILLNLHGRTHEDNASDQGVLVMPLTQSHLADLAGMTHVHMNRTLMKLKYIGLIQSRSSRWILPDLDALKRLAQGAAV